MGEHLIYKEEAVAGTWITPDKAVWAKSVGIARTQPQMDAGETGFGEGAMPGMRGEVGVAGPSVHNLRTRRLGDFFRSVYGTRVAVAAGTGWKNKLLPLDGFEFLSFSMQKKYSATVAESISGARLNGFTIAAAARQYAQATFDWVAEDAAISGGFWADGVSAAPAVIASPAYPTPFSDGLTFYQGVMRLGGSVVNTAGELVVSGGVARNDFDNISLQHSHNISTDGYGINLGDRTVQSMERGARGIALSFDPNFRQSGNEFYRAWAEGTPAVVELFFQGAIYNAASRYELKFTYPYVLYGGGATPELNPTLGLKRHTVPGVAYVDPVLGVDHGVVIQGIETLV